MLLAERLSNRSAKISSIRRRRRALALVTGPLLDAHEPERSALFARAAELCRQGCYDVEVLHVAPTQTGGSIAPASSELNPDVRAERRALRELVQRANRRYQVDLRASLIESNDRAAATMAAAARSGASLILKQMAGGRVDYDKPTDEALQRWSDVPVWFIKSAAPVERVVAAVRGAVSEDDYRSCSTARDVEGLLQAELKVLMVCSTDALVPVCEVAPPQQSAVQLALGEVHALAEPHSMHIGALIEQFDIDPQQVEVQPGVGEQGIADGVKRLNADLVVAGAQSVSAMLMRNAQCDVLYCCDNHPPSLPAKAARGYPDAREVSTSGRALIAGAELR